VCSGCWMLFLGSGVQWVLDAVFGQWCAVGVGCCFWEVVCFWWPAGGHRGLCALIGRDCDSADSWMWNSGG